tara:strand:+ start:3728 stop:4513 length:786 start_codon:yes stop_codon:yes gene_type:complete
MDSSQLFTARIPELESLPAQPCVYWYPSAGIDFRGPVAFTYFRIQHEKKYHGRNYRKPDLFILNCLGSEVTDLRRKLEQEIEVNLFNDHNTIIKAKNYQSLEIRDDIIFETNPEYIDFEVLENAENQTNTALYFEIEVAGENYLEVQKILYFQVENIEFFKKVILVNIFEILYLCSTREGLAWGFCKKSIIEYIYSDNHPYFFYEHVFRPTFIIISRNYTKQIFEDAVENTDSLSVKSNYGNFISESDDFTNDPIIYKINY